MEDQVRLDTLEWYDPENSAVVSRRCRVADEKSAAQEESFLWKKEDKGISS